MRSYKLTEGLFRGEFVHALDTRIQPRARERLKYLDSASDLRDLMVPPSNRLEWLTGDRKGQCSIGISRQWSVCFKMEGWGAFEVAKIEEG